MPNYDIGTKGHFVAPEGKSVADNFIEGALYAGEQLIFDVSGKETIHLGMKLFVSSGVKYELEFTLKDGPPNIV